MTYPQLNRYIGELRQSGYDVLEHEVELHRKVAFPFVTLVMTLHRGAVRSDHRPARSDVRHRRRHRAGARLLDDDLGVRGVRRGRVMSPLLAAWAPNLLFGAAAIVLLLTVRT
jgi:lipopolysaccharide export LptBFGC system permease protein LptF